MPLDLDSLKDFVEEEMTDACTITRDTSGTADDDYDEDAAEYTPEGLVVVYRGRCFLSTQGWQPSTQDQGGQEVIVSAFKLVLPIKAATIKLEDVIELTSSMRNPRLKGQSFVVKDRIDSSHSISQNVLVNRIQPRPPL